MSLSNKVILTDVDGVLLDWNAWFDVWMKKHGHTKIVYDSYSIAQSYGMTEKTSNMYCNMFNETVYVQNLPPLRDAIKYVTKLHKNLGYVFHAITSLGDDYYVANSRKANLEKLFGESVFTNITCLGSQVCKSTVLKQYSESGCWWIEDHPDNFEIGNALGLSCLLMEQEYNQDNKIIKANKVKNWKSIYKLIKACHHETLCSF